MNTVYTAIFLIGRLLDSQLMCRLVYREKYYYMGKNIICYYDCVTVNIPIPIMVYYIVLHECIIL